MCVDVTGEKRNDVLVNPFTFAWTYRGHHGLRRNWAKFTFFNSKRSIQKFQLITWKIIRKKKRFDYAIDWSNGNRKKIKIYVALTHKRFKKFKRISFLSRQFSTFSQCCGHLKKKINKETEGKTIIVNKIIQ